MTVGRELLPEEIIAARMAEAEATEDAPAVSPGNVTASGRHTFAVGRLVPVRCTVPGYEHITVWYRTNNRWSVVNDPLPDEDKRGGLRLMAAIAKRFEGWDLESEFTGEPIPAPDPADIDSYASVFRGDAELREWVLGAGYQAALRGTLAPNF